MPASYLHQSVARAVTGGSPAALAGAEGPDPLFYCFHHAKGAPLPFALGSRLHKSRTGAFLLSLLRSAKTPAQRDYALGFLTHYATDTTFHPFVYAHANAPEGKYSTNLHCTLEHALDAWLYRIEGHETGTPRHMAGVAALRPDECEEIANLLCTAVLETYSDVHVQPAFFQHAFKDSAALTRILHSPGGTKYAVFGALARPFGLKKTLHAHMVPTRLPEGDFLNLARDTWESPFKSGERRDSVPELLAAAKARAASFVSAGRAYLAGELAETELSGILGSMSYDSGLPCRE